MGFTMRVCNGLKTYALVLLAGLMFSPVAKAESFVVKAADIYAVGNAYVLNARIDYPLNPRVLEALYSGVPLTFFQEFKLTQTVQWLGRWGIWSRERWSNRISYELRYHSLTEQYLLRDLATQKQQTFPTLDDALLMMGQIIELPLPPQWVSQAEGWTLNLRSGLDLMALPTPMRPGALVSDRWQLTSPWSTATWR